MTDGVNTTLFYRKPEEDDWKPVITTNFKESFSPKLSGSARFKLLLFLGPASKFGQSAPVNSIDTC
jgi:hypothetical protein